MAKLGYKWYPENWTSDKDVFDLNLAERGLYRELIDIAMESDNEIEIKIKSWARQFNSTIDEIKTLLIRLAKNPKLIIIENEKIFIPSCEKRLSKIRNGRKGGAPVGNNNASKNNRKTTGKQPLKINLSTGIISRSNVDLIHREIDYLKDKHDYDPGMSDEIGNLTSINEKLKHYRERDGRPVDDDHLFDAFVYFVEHREEWRNFSIKTFDNNFEQIRHHIKNAGSGKSDDDDGRGVAHPSNIKRHVVQ